MRRFRFVLGNLLMILITATTMSNCSSDNEACSEVPENIQPIEFIDFDKTILDQETPEEVLALLNKHKGYKDMFLESNQFPSDTILAQSVFKFANHISFDTLRMETKYAFGDQSQLKKEFELAFARLKQFYPDVTIPKIYTTLTGLGKEMYLSDSLIVISLDYYAGEGATYRPLNIPHYILRRYEKEYVTNLVMSYISNGYNKVDPKDNTMLGEMIDYGKSMYFNSQVLPCKSDTVITGFTGLELRKVNANQELIWGHIIEKKLLYETNHFIKNKYIGERPSVYEIGEDCPGRVGRWVGLEIVRTYMQNNPKVSLSELMNESDAQKIFNGAKYKPVNTVIN